MQVRLGVETETDTGACPSRPGSSGSLERTQAGALGRPGGEVRRGSWPPTVWVLPDSRGSPRGASLHSGMWDASWCDFNKSANSFYATKDLLFDNSQNFSLLKTLFFILKYCRNRMTGVMFMVVVLTYFILANQRTTSLTFYGNFFVIANKRRDKDQYNVFSFLPFFNPFVPSIQNSK